MDIILMGQIFRWRRHIHLTGSPPDQVMFAWEDVKAMFNGGSRKRVASGSGNNAGSVVTSTSNNQSGPSAEAPAKSSQEVVVAATKVTKTTKNPCHSKRPKFDGGQQQHLPKIRTPENLPAAAATTSSTSSSPPVPLIPAPSPLTPQIYHHPAQSQQSLLARLNSIMPTAAAGSLLPNKPATDPAPTQDYSMTMWNATGSGRFWSPYLNPLPFNPYSYYNYLMNKSDQFSLMMNHSGSSGWQQLVTNKPRINPASISIIGSNNSEPQKSGMDDTNSKSHQSNNNSPTEEEEAEAFVDVESTDPALENN